MATPREIAAACLNMDSPIDVAGVLEESAAVLDAPEDYSPEERRRSAVVLRELGALFKRHATTL